MKLGALAFTRGGKLLVRGANVLPIPRRHKDAGGKKRGSVIRDEMLRFRGVGAGEELAHVDGGEDGRDGVVHCEDLR